MTVYVYQTFQLKQEAFKEGLENLQEMKDYRNEKYNHNVRILTPLTGPDHTYALVAEYDGLAEMELQNAKMFEDDDYLDLAGRFFLEDIVQGSMNTQLFRDMKHTKSEKEKEED